MTIIYRYLTVGRILRQIVRAVHAEMDYTINL